MKVSKILRAKLGDEVRSSKVFFGHLILRITKRANIHIIFLFSYS